METTKICRTCLRPTKKHTSIFTAPNLWGKNIVLAKMIMACAPIIIDIDDGLPTRICENCLQLLQLSFLFRLRVITANKHFKDIIRTQVVSQNQVTNETPQDSLYLNSIYSTDYILESIKDSAPAGETLKQEPLDIKEEPEDDNENNHTITSLISNEGKSLNNNSQEVINNLNDVVTPQLKNLNHQINISCQENQQINNPSNNGLLILDKRKENQNQQENKCSYENLGESLKIINNVQLNEENQEQNKINSENLCKNPKIINDALHDYPAMDNVAHYVIINTEKPINNQINLNKSELDDSCKVNFKLPLKRTFVRLHDINKITKFQKMQKSKSLSETKTNLLSDNKLEEILDVKQTLQNNQLNNECIIIDD